MMSKLLWQGELAVDDRTVSLFDHVRLEIVKVSFSAAVIGCCVFDDFIFAVLEGGEVGKLCRTSAVIEAVQLGADCDWKPAAADFAVLKVTQMAGVERCSHFGCETLAAPPSDAVQTDQLFTIDCTDFAVYLLDTQLSRLYQIYSSKSAERPTILQCAVADECRLTRLHCGKAHCLLLDERGAVYTFGSGTRGELGHGDLTSEPLPTLVDALDGVVVQRLAVGGWHSAALTRDGDVYMWGWNESGQLGVDSAETPMAALPLPLELDEGIVSVACGSRHTLLLTESAVALGCGWNAYGQSAATDGAIVRLADRVSALSAAGWSTRLFAKPQPSPPAVPPFAR